MDQPEARERGEQADDKPDTATDGQSLAAQVIPCLLHAWGAVGSDGDERDALHSKLLVADQVDECVEVVLGQIGDEVRGDDDVEFGVTHQASAKLNQLNEYSTGVFWV